MRKRKNRNMMTAALLALCLTIALTVPAAAAGTGLTEPGGGITLPDQPPGITPSYIGTEHLAAQLEISGTGYATCIGDADMEVGYTARATMELQRLSGGSWTTIRSWTSTGFMNTFYEGYYVLRGYDYRVKVTAQAYNYEGLLTETVSVCSPVVCY